MEFKHTEATTQLAIFNYRNHIQLYPLLFPNVYIHGWESDVVYVSKDRYAQELEIKITHDDFLADRKKIVKHRLLHNHSTLFRHFWYVCPPDVIEVSELPEYAGLLYVTYSDWWKCWTLTKMRQAPIIGKEPLSEEQVMKLLRKGLDRYWSLRERNGLQER